MGLAPSLWTAHDLGSLLANVFDTLWPELAEGIQGKATREVEQRRKVWNELNGHRWRVVGSRGLVIKLWEIHVQILATKLPA